MQGFGEHITVLVNSLLLCVVYLIGVGITSIIAKIFRKQFLDMQLKKEGSYWTTLDLKKKDKEDYYRQF